MVGGYLYDFKKDENSLIIAAGCFHGLLVAALVRRTQALESAK